ncbi:MAG TPA: type VI secretion system protein TssA [Polyangiaceae bacterium]|nr:type VI secretion system protein TssA [Polyangiaceae bacterium]
MFDSERLLAPISPADPAGANLEYDPAFAELERLAMGKPERQMGDSIVPGEPPDWSAVFDRAVLLLERSKDLRVASYLGLAVLHRAGFEGLSRALAFLRSLLEAYWPLLHPELDPDDGDATVRVTALAGLGTPQVIVALRNAPLLRARSLGAVTLRDLLASNTDGSRASDTAGPDAGTVDAIFREAELQALVHVVDSIKAASGHLAAIEAVFETHTGARGPDFSALLALLHQASHSLQARLQARRPAEAAATNVTAATDGEAMPSSDSGPPAARPLDGDINSRADVLRALEKICSYYERHEPSSPLPLLLQRCKRLVPLGFVDILRDMAPDALSQVELIAGKTGE